MLYFGSQAHMSQPPSAHWIDNPQITARLFLCVSAAALLASILRRSFGSAPGGLTDGMLLFNSLIFAYFAWTKRAGIRHDEFTRAVAAHGAQFGVLAAVLVGVCGQWFVAPGTPAAYVVTGMAYGGFLAFAVGVVYQWWILRR